MATSMYQPLHKDKIFLSIVGVLCFLLLCLFMWNHLTVGKCTHYSTQEEAQKDLLTYPSLDGGKKDGKACNSYF